MGRDGRGVKAASETTIEISFMFKGVRCRERISLPPTPTNLKRATNHRAAILNEIEAGTFDYATVFPKSKNAVKFAKQAGDVETIAVYLESWLKRKKQELKSSTFNGYSKIVKNQLIPLFGELKLSELKKRHVREILSERDATNKTLSNIQSPLRVALQDAVEDELIEVNPIAGWTYSKAEPPRAKDKVDPFTKEEQRLILDACSGQFRNQIQFLLWTGLRTSEVVALNWDDIDFVRNVIVIDKAKTQYATEAETTKTKSGTREVKLLDMAREALINQKQYTFLNNEEIFQNPTTGQRWLGDQAIRKNLFIPTLKRAKVRYRNPYQTRHTYASMMLSAGEHPMWVAKQMGHTDWTMIARVYGKWMPDADTLAGSKAEAIFGNGGVSKPLLKGV